MTDTTHYLNQSVPKSGMAEQCSSNPDLKTCTKCHGTYDTAVFFRFSRGESSAYDSHRPTCIGCEQTARDATKRQNRWLRKAGDSLRGHARKLKINPTEMATHYRWDTARMAHEAEHVYSNGCPECGEAFLEMGHGLADITLDVIDPQAPPIYGLNTRWICMTCNRGKGKTPIAVRAAKALAWAQWRAQQVKNNHDPWANTLFEGTDFR